MKFLEALSDLWATVSQYQNLVISSLEFCISFFVLFCKLLKDFVILEAIDNCLSI